MSRPHTTDAILETLIETRDMLEDIHDVLVDILHVLDDIRDNTEKRATGEEPLTSAELKTAKALWKSQD